MGRAARRGRASSAWKPPEAVDEAMRGLRMEVAALRAELGQVRALATANASASTLPRVQWADLTIDDDDEMMPAMACAEGALGTQQSIEDVTGELGVKDDHCGMGDPVAIPSAAHVAGNVLLEVSVKQSGVIGDCSQHCSPASPESAISRAVAELGAEEDALHERGAGAAHATTSGLGDAATGASDHAALILAHDESKDYSQNCSHTCSWSALPCSIAEEKLQFVQVQNHTSQGCYGIEEAGVDEEFPHAQDRPGLRFLSESDLAAWKRMFEEAIDTFESCPGDLASVKSLERLLKWEPT